MEYKCVRGWAHVSGTKEGMQPTCRQTYTDGHLQRGYNLHVQADMYRPRWMNTQPQTHLKTPTPIQEGGLGGVGTVSAKPGRAHTHPHLQYFSLLPG